MDLFEIKGVLPDLNFLVERAKMAIADLFRKGHPICIAWSSGKDSSAVLALTLETALEVKAQGIEPRIVVCSSDTGMENPEIAAHVRDEARKVMRYAQANGLNVSVYITKPSLMATWQIKVLSGRGLPDYAGQKSDCSVDWKIKPMQKLRNQLFASFRKEGLPEPVTLVGTRYSESQRRALAMQSRGDNSLEPVRNKDEEWTLTPICRWQTDDVWTYIGEIAAGQRKSYSDFAETLRIYADAGGTSCAVVSDALLEGLNKSNKAGKCGARTGCWCCLQAHDKSLRTMVENEPRYHYARGLVRFNEYLRAIRWDWSRRHYVGRTVKEGYLCIAPDCFHPSEVRRQTRMLLQLDYDEEIRARRAGESPRFKILPLETLIALDALQSLHGIGRPFAIWNDLRLIKSGIRFDIPTNLVEVPETPMPEARFIHVGQAWEGAVWDGLRDAYREALTEDSPCAPKIADDGLWELDTEVSFTVDPEGAMLFEDFEVDYVLAQYDQGVPPGGVTAGFKHYLGLGTIQLSHGQRAWADVALRRTALKDRLGLTLDYQIEDIISQSVRFADMPEEARRAWSKKATTSSAQADLF